MKSLKTITYLSILFSFTVLDIPPLFSLSTRFYLTSNLAGGFPLDPADMKNKMLVVAQALNSERKKNPRALYLDLGNAFYPGRLSRYSFGSLTADYLQMLKLDAGLIAADDMNIGVGSLEYIRTARDLALVSGNILKEKENTPLFSPMKYFQTPLGKIAVIGITSQSALIQHEEAALMGLSIQSPQKALTTLLGSIKPDKADFIVVLTNLELNDALALLSEFPRLDMIICGADSTGQLSGQNIEQIKIQDGRSVLSVPRHPLVSVDLSVRKNRLLLENTNEITLPDTYEPNTLTPSFVRRLQTWRNGYLDDQKLKIPAQLEERISLDHRFVAGAMRDHFYCDVGIVEERDIRETILESGFSGIDLSQALRNDYTILKFDMRGDQLNDISKYQNLVLSGMQNKRITGIPIESKLSYPVCATQRGYQYISQMLNTEIPAQKTWRSMTDVVGTALSESSTRPEQSADRNFRLLTLARFSNVYESATVRRDAAMSTPPGQASDNYLKWGLENDINFKLYNRHHIFTINPYLFYVRQNDNFMRNLLRGTVAWSLNTDFLLRPYQKNQLDTVVVPLQGERPSILRETMGVEINYRFISGRLGVGMEKQVLNPVQDPSWGFEAIIKSDWEILPRITYQFSLDTFISSDPVVGRMRNRSDIGNALVFSVYEPLAISMRHRWFYYYTPLANAAYDSSIFMVSADLRFAVRSD